MQNCINIRTDRFKKQTRFLKHDIKNLNFEKGLVSFDSKNLEFTNYARSQNEDVFNILLNYYLYYLENDFSFLNDEFIGDEILQDDKAKRLLNIINASHKSKYKAKDLANIYKFKSCNDKRLHLYIKVSRKNWTIVLIDLYHLGIFGEYFVNGKKVKSSISKIYKRQKNNKIDIKIIKELSSS